MLNYSLLEWTRQYTFVNFFLSTSNVSRSRVLVSTSHQKINYHFPTLILRIRSIPKRSNTDLRYSIFNPNMLSTPPRLGYPGRGIICYGGLTRGASSRCPLLSSYPLFGLLGLPIDDILSTVRDDRRRLLESESEKLSRVIPNLLRTAHCFVVSIFHHYHFWLILVYFF